MDVVFDTIVPVFAVIGVGWLFGRREDADLRTLSDLALLVTSPALLFSVLSGTSLDAGRWGVLSGATIWMLLGTGLLGLPSCGSPAWAGGPSCPASSSTAATWGSPARAWPSVRGPRGGRLRVRDDGAARLLLRRVDREGENGLGEALRMPLLYGSAGGLGLALTGTELPRRVMEPIEMLGAMAIPLMLLNLGMQLRMLAVRDVRHAVGAVAIRMGGGFLFMWAFVVVAGVGGSTDRCCCSSR